MMRIFVMTLILFIAAVFIGLSASKVDHPNIPQIHLKLTGTIIILCKRIGFLYGPRSSLVFVLASYSSVQACAITQRDMW